MIPNGYISNDDIIRDFCIELMHFSRCLSALEKRISIHATHRNLSLGSQIQLRRELNIIIEKCDDIKDLISKIDECQGKLRAWRYDNVEKGDCLERVGKPPLKPV